MNGLTETIANFISTTSLTDVPVGAVDRAKLVIADTFAAIVASAGSDISPPLLAYIQASEQGGRSVILGSGITASPEAAAFVNGSFGAALEFDDVLSQMPAHPSSVIVSALMAGIKPNTVNGEAFIEAYVIGLEVGAKIAVGMTLQHYQRGFHATGTLALFSALAALAKLHRADVAMTRNAFGIAASMSSGIACNFGTMVKPMHSGWAARSALAAITLAQNGFTGAQHALEAKQGYFEVFGTTASDPQLTVNSLGKPWTIMEPGITLKKFPCCYPTHRGIDGLLQVKSTLKLNADNLKSLECWLPPGGGAVMIYPDPKDGFESKFSMEYALAAGVLDDEYTLWTFGDEAVRRPRIRELLKKIHITEDERCRGNDPLFEKRSSGTRGVVEVEAHTVDGRSAMATVEIPPGHPKRGLNWNDMHDKFDICTRSGGIDVARSEQAFAVLRGLENCPDVTAISGLLAGSSR